MTRESQVRWCILSDSDLDKALDAATMCKTAALCEIGIYLNWCSIALNYGEVPFLDNLYNGPSAEVS